MKNETFNNERDARKAARAQFMELWGAGEFSEAFQDHVVEYSDDFVPLIADEDWTALKERTKSWLDAEADSYENDNWEEFFENEDDEDGEVESDEDKS